MKAKLIEQNFKRGGDPRTAMELGEFKFQDESSEWGMKNYPRNLDEKAARSFSWQPIPPITITEVSRDIRDTKTVDIRIDFSNNDTLYFEIKRGKIEVYVYIDNKEHILSDQDTKEIINHIKTKSKGSVIPALLKAYQKEYLKQVNI